MSDFNSDYQKLDELDTQLATLDAQISILKAKKSLALALKNAIKVKLSRMS